MMQIAACNSWTCPDQLLNVVLPWLPRAASLHGATIDRLMDASLLILFALCLLAQALIVAGLILRRERHVRLSSAWRWGAIAFVVAFFVWMTIEAEQLWSTIRIARAASNTVHVEVTGVQFQWYFRYPGPDGVYGRTRTDLIDAATGNPLGIDPTDPHSRDDVVSSVLILPVSRQVDLGLRAQDVVHGFYIPAMRLMQNATPGMVSTIHLTPTRIGDYPIVCSQLCGLGHYRMRAVLRVVPAREFEEWMQQREKDLAER